MRGFTQYFPSFLLFIFLFHFYLQREAVEAATRKPFAEGEEEWRPGRGGGTDDGQRESPGTHHLPRSREQVHMSGLPATKILSRVSDEALGDIGQYRG